RREAHAGGGAGEQAHERAAEEGRAGRATAHPGAGGIHEGEGGAEGHGGQGAGAGGPAAGAALGARAPRPEGGHGGQGAPGAVRP
ncbi:unnamed protein product, partial [Heterosigma akashiwo]